MMSALPNPRRNAHEQSDTRAAGGESGDRRHPERLQQGRRPQGHRPPRGLFTADATFDYGHGNVTQGRENLRGLFVAATGKYTATSHHVSTINYVRMDDGTASTITYVYAFHDTGDAHFHVWGCYEDELVDDGDRWRIAARRVRPAGAKTTTTETLPDRFERYPRPDPR